MIPESRLIRSELTIREMSLPNEVLLARKSLVRWVALSIGMIMPNESRRLLLDIFEVLVEFHVRRQEPTTKDILVRLEELTGSPPNPKAVYYHLLRLRNIGLLKRKKGRYHFGDGDGKSLKDVFRVFYARRSDEAFANMALALEKLENGYL